MPGRERQRAKTSEQSPPDSVSGIRRCLLPKTAPAPLLLLTESNPLRLGFDSGIRRLGDRGVASRLPVPISAWGRRCPPLTGAPFRQKAGCFLTRERRTTGFPSAGSHLRLGAKMYTSYARSFSSKSGMLFDEETRERQVRFLRRLAAQARFQCRAGNGKEPKRRSKVHRIPFPASGVAFCRKLHRLPCSS